MDQELPHRGRGLATKLISGFFFLFFFQELFDAPKSTPLAIITPDVRHRAINTKKVYLEQIAAFSSCSWTQILHSTSTSTSNWMQKLSKITIFRHIIYGALAWHWSHRRWNLNGQAHTCWYIMRKWCCFGNIKWFNWCNSTDYKHLHHPLLRHRSHRLQMPIPREKINRLRWFQSQLDSNMHRVHFVPLWVNISCLGSG
jgi:hypothetical protein